MKYFESALGKVSETMDQERIQKNNIQEHLKQYRSPFKVLLENNDIELDSEVEHDKLEIEAREGGTSAKLSV